MQPFVRNPGKTSFFRTVKRGCAIVTLASLSACNSSPSRVNQPYIDASAAGDAAMEQYDTNGDGVVKGAELEKAPGLNAALAKLDKNGDKGVSAEEVSERVAAWQKMGVGLMSFGFKVTMNGNPLPDATVTFEPESFLGSEIKSADGVTVITGGGSATIPKDQRPDATSPPGMQLGLYKVKISKLVNGKEMIPARYNESTILGQECASDVSDILNNRVAYELTSK